MVAMQMRVDNQVYVLGSKPERREITDQSLLALETDLFAAV